MGRLLLEVLSALLAAIERARVKREQDAAQAEANSVSSNPTGWFNKHFGLQQPDGKSKEATGETGADNSSSSGQ